MSSFVLRVARRTPAVFGKVGLVEDPVFGIAGEVLGAARLGEVMGWSSKSHT